MGIGPDMPRGWSSRPARLSADVARHARPRSRGLPWALRPAPDAGAEEEVDLLEVDLAEVVLAYVEHLERAGELDLEAATEFLVLIAALLELKSRLMLPRRTRTARPRAARGGQELLARMLEYHRYRGAAEHLRERPRGRARPTATARRRCRWLRRVLGRGRGAAYDPRSWPRPSAGCSQSAAARPAPRRPTPPCPSSSDCTTSRRLLALAPKLLVRRRRQRQPTASPRPSPCSPCSSSTRRARPLGAGWPFGPITGGARVNELARAVEALLFLRPSRSPSSAWPMPARSPRGRSSRRSPGCASTTPRASAGSSCARSPGLHARHRPDRRARRAAAAGPTAHPAADPGAGRVPGDRRLPAAGLAAGDRPHPWRGVGVRRRHAARARPDRGVGAVRSAPLYRTTELFQKLFGLSGLDALPDPAASTRAGGGGGAARAAAAGRRAARARPAG